jgi:hypothetical protein
VKAGLKGGGGFAIVRAVFVPGVAQMADETRGGMDIRMHQDMWAAFCQLTKWGVIVGIGTLILMALFLL